MIPPLSPNVETLKELKIALKKEWLLCDRGTEDSFAYMIDVIFPLFEMKAQAHDAAIRNATLDSVQKLLREEAQIDDNDQYYLWLEDIECAVESLRGEPCPPPRSHRRRNEY